MFLKFPLCSELKEHHWEHIGTQNPKELNNPPKPPPLPQNKRLTLIGTC